MPARHSASARARVGGALPTLGGAGSSRGRIVAFGLLVGWAVLLATGILDPPGRAAAGGSGLFDLRSGAALWSAASTIATWAVFEALRFVPLGLLAVFVTPDRPRRLGRALLVALPALGLALLLAVLVLGVQARGRGGAAPGPSDFLLPGVGLVLGVAAALAWRRGPRARWLFVPRVALAVALVLMLAGAVVAASLEAGPAAPEPPVVDSAGKRRIHAALRGKDPRRVPEGQQRTLSLTRDEMDFVLAWGLPLVLGPDRARVAVSLDAPDRAGAVASTRLPGTDRWLNVDASARVRVEGGRLGLSEARLRFGQVGVPAPLLAAAVPVLEVALQNDRRLRPVLEVTDRLEIEGSGARVTYRRLDTPPGFFARLVWGEGAEEEMREAVAEHTRSLLQASDRLPRGDERFGAALEVAFASARERSARGSAVQENRAAILALGMLFGHRRLERFVGDVLEDSERGRARALGRPTLRGRRDWPRHFLVSAALTVLSAEAPSDAAGLLKEELDAARGSGFSFGDLLADRAGTTFAAVATRDEASAVAVQERLAGGFRVDDFFPEAADMPENLPDTELQAVYGGVGGEGYQEVLGEIERRVAACPAYGP